MSSATSQAENRNTALQQLRFRKQSQLQAATSGASPSSSSTNPSWNFEQSVVSPPPPQSRDASVASRFFNTTSAFPGKVLVPSSSPLRPDSTYRPHQSSYEDSTDSVPSLSSGHQSEGSAAAVNVVDPLSVSSGFTRGGGSSYAYFTRPGDGNVQSESSSYGERIRDGEPPRKRLNRGSPSSDPRALFDGPNSPEVIRPGQRRKLNPGGIQSSASSDESFSETSADIVESSRPRIVRGHRPELSELPALDSSPSETLDKRFTQFKLMQPFWPPMLVQAAWQEARGDEAQATRFLDDPIWRTKKSAPTTTSPSKQPSAETGRVREVEEASRAQRELMKEKRLKSAIYAKPSAPVSGPQKSPAKPALAKSPPPTPGSPEIVPSRAKRLKRKVVETDSESEEADFEESDEDTSHKSSDGDPNEAQALDYLNTATTEALQELTGCSPEQAAKIIELRPFSTVEDVKTKLGQGRKKAGPAGISPRMFEDCTATFEGYSEVDNILQKIEKVGKKLKAEISRWTDNAAVKGKTREGTPATPASRDSPFTTSEIADDGALSLRSQAILSSTRPKYFISAQPATLSEDVKLKDYQMLGINWLNLLYREEHSCILADEMGLGKTVQVISFFAHLRDQGSKGPHMVIVPSSTLENWIREFSRFAPDMEVRAYYADKNERPRLRQELEETQRTKDPHGWEILITTYNLAQGDEKDRKFFKKIKWDACVFDEGHVLKNFQSQRYQTLLKYQAKWRLLLTGTPLQNNLQELVSLMNFIQPHHFREGMEAVRAVFKTKGDSKVTLLAQQRVSRAKKMMTPFVLRRRKDQVLQDLPRKTERIEWCEMTPAQRTIYNDALRRSRKTVFDLEDGNKDSREGSEAPAPENGKKAPKKKVGKAAAGPRGKDKMYLENSTNVLMDLRKAASHPMLFRKRFTDDALTSIARVLLKEPDFRKRGAVFEYVKEDMQVMTDAELQVFCATYKSTRKYLQDEACYLQAGKVKVLLKLLQDYQEQGRRVLIFSQFTQILDILQRVLNMKKLKYLVLTGSTPVDARQSLVDEFTEDESIPVFLLSTKAGGMGINLTAASVVIMFDQDFNPHNDKQAQDRAYRIGQKRNVDVIKLITKGSIEEDMLELGRTKLALDEAVAGEGEDGSGEGETKVEREMKASLMSVVRKKLEEVGTAEDGDVEMVVDDGGS